MEIVLTETYCNPYSGMTTEQFTPYAYKLIADWLEQQGDDPASTIRSLRTCANGNYSFKHGGGYAILDADLLGGTGSGERERKFREDHPGVRFTWR